MALIVCPECRKEVSDLATSCPNCGFPIKNLQSDDGMVQIRVNPLKSSTGFNGNQRVSIFVGENIIWVGNVGDTANLKFSSPTTIKIQYHLSLMHYGGSCTGTIDSSKSKKYVVSARQGVMSTKIILQPVDIFDAD